MNSTICSVALPLPSADPYSYEIPTTLRDRVLPGARVVVPVRSSMMVGVAVDVGEGDRTGLKQVILAPDPEPLVPGALLDLAGWVSRYYATPLGLALKTMLPAALWGRSQLVATIADEATVPGGTSADVLAALQQAGGKASATQLGRRLRRPVWDALQRLARSGAIQLETEPPHLGPHGRQERLLRLVRALPTILERDEVFGRAKAQRALYEAVDELGGTAPIAHLTQAMGFSDAVVRALVQRGLGRVELRETLRDPFEDVPGSTPPDPNAEQLAAVQVLDQMAPDGVGLLHGVTGSGKTLVYLETLKHAVDRGGGAIVLVPEIALTPQTITRVRGVFGEEVAVLHSGLSESERVDAWRALLRGDKRVAVGARSAIFAPVPRLSAIVIDEEHDASYKHGERPRYHARDVALRRGRREGARVILGTATPALETWAARDRITTVSLPTRVGPHPLPPVDLIDLRSAEQVKGSGPVPWSEPLDAATGAALESGEQVLLLLNRRGFAHFLQCHACGHVWECPACSISLTVHRAPARLRCHYCGHDQSAPATCDQCGGDVHRTRGVGTQHVERWLAERFPTARLARMDADTTSRKWSHRDILDAVRRREVDILLGTQMIAKGLDFPGVTLVGVIDADTGLHLPDFRAAERTFQMVAQVAGRAGRGPKGGRVLVQTRAPTHYALTAAAAHDFQQFADRELEVRRDPPYPPHVGLVNVVVSGPEEPAVVDAAVAVAEWTRGLIAKHGEGRVDVVGPAPAPLARIKHRWRWHLVLRSKDRALLGTVMRYAAGRVPHSNRGPIRVSFDRDPVSLL